MSSTVKNPDIRLLHVIAGIARHWGREWCYPTQDTLRQRLAQRYGRAMSIRTINRHLLGLEEGQFIRRIRRHRRVPGQGTHWRSTVYVLLKRARVWFARLVGGWISARENPPVINAPSRVPHVAHNVVPNVHRSGSDPPSPGRAAWNTMLERMRAQARAAKAR